MRGQRDVLSGGVTIDFHSPAIALGCEDQNSRGFVEDNLWTGISRARSGCGAAIFGTPDRVIAKLRAYQDAGMEAFILSGYPYVNECDMFARYVLPQLQHGPLTL